MKKYLYTFLFSLFLLPIFVNYQLSEVNAEFSGTGTGVDIDPYVITTCEQLQEINDDPTAYYILGQDIDCINSINWNEGLGFEPIGGGQDFWGTLDGMYYTIYDLYINRSGSYNVGIFNTVEGGIVGGLNIERANIVGAGSVGIITGRSSVGEFYDINVVNSIVVGENMDGQVGGLVGYSDDEILFEGCSFGGTVTGNYAIGGLLGYSSSVVSISNSHNTGTINGNYNIGGLLGDSDDAVTISNSYNEGILNGKYIVGGLAGDIEGVSSILDSFNTGEITGDQRVGGLVGYSYKDISITDSYNLGIINGYYRTGGLLGSVEEKVTLLRSNNKGDINSLIDNYDPEETPPLYTDEYICVGGLVGAGWKSEIDKSYNEGDIQAIGGARSVGGLLGCGGLTSIEESYNSGDITTQLIRSNGLAIDGIGGLVGIGINLNIYNSYNNGLFNASIWESDIEYFEIDMASPFMGGLVGFAIVSDIQNSYSDTNIDINDLGSNGIYTAIGGLIGAEVMERNILSDISNILGKDFVLKTTDFFINMFNNFANLILHNYDASYENLTVGGLIGWFAIEDCEGDNCELDLAIINNNWWSSSIQKGVGASAFFNNLGPSFFNQDEAIGFYERVSSMDIFKTYSHKVYNTNPDWDFDTIWSNIYEEKGYPVLRIQNLVMPSNPISSVNSGTYSSGFNITVTSEGSESIRYTIDGSLPTCSTGLVYSSPVQILQSTEIKAIGCIDSIFSNISVFSYIISSNEAPPPVVDPIPQIIKKKTYKPITIVEILELEEEPKEEIVEELEVEEDVVEEIKEEVEIKIFRIKIVDEDGNALVGARVMLDRKEYITDSNGQIVANGLEKGDYILKITHEGKEYEQGVVLGTQDEAYQVVIEKDGNFPWWIVIVCGGTLVMGISYKVFKKRN